MNILVIGDADSIWTKKYIEEVLLTTEHTIYLASFSAKIKYLDYYKETGVNLIRLTVPKQIPFKPLCMLRNAMSYGRWEKQLKKIAKFDVIHIHSVNLRSLRVVRRIQDSTTRLVLSYWGSDILRKKDKYKKWEKKYLYDAAVITLSARVMTKRFQVTYGHIFDEKLKEVYFGVPGFDNIRKIKETQTKTECKAHFGLDAQKITVAVGYSKIAAQQHDKVLAVLNQLPTEVQNKMELVLHVGYGPCSAEYWAGVMALAEKLHCKVTVIEHFLDQDEMAKLRIAVDIYINAQTTDAFSASVQEFLYAGATVLNPTWIPYEELTDMGIWDIKYSSFPELLEILPSLLETSLDRSKDNMALADHTSWSGVREKWLSCYED